MFVYYADIDTMRMAADVSLNLLFALVIVNMNQKPSKVRRTLLFVGRDSNPKKNLAYLRQASPLRSRNLSQGFLKFCPGSESQSVRFCS